MEYNKPEIVALGNAALAIQTGDKQEQQVQDSIEPQLQQSLAAYEADE
jgi:hypothetical protein